MNIKLDIGLTFALCCGNNLFDMAKWLYNTCGIISDEYVRKAFRWGCSHDNICLLEWIFNLGRINRICLNDCLIDVCSYNDLKMAIWLKGLGANIYFRDNEALKISSLYGCFTVRSWLLNQMYGHQ